MLKSNCVSVECHNNKDYVGICATNEGAIRFWPSIFNEYLCVDTKIDLQQGDEVAHLMFIGVNYSLIQLRLALLSLFLFVVIIVHIVVFIGEFLCDHNCQWQLVEHFDRNRRWQSK